MKSKIFYLLAMLFIGFGANTAFAQNPGTPQDVKITSALQVLLNQPKVEVVNVNDLRPRWFCPFFYTQDETVSDGLSELIVSNFSIKPIDIRIIFYDHRGKVVKTHEEELPGKALRYIELHIGYFNDDFAGSIELQSNSPAVFPTLHFTEEMKIPTASILGKIGKPKTVLKSVCMDWYRLD